MSATSSVKNVGLTVAVVLATCLGFKEEEVKPEQRLVEELGADSLDVVEIWMALEEEFDVEMPDEEVEALKTVEQIVAYVKGKVGEA